MSQGRDAPAFQIVEFPDAEMLVQIPAGEYSLKLASHKTGIFFKTPRLVLNFAVADFGPYHGATLSRFYNVVRLIGKPGRNGGCKHKKTGDFSIEFFTLFPDQPRRRMDRIPLEPFYNSLIVGRVRDVTTNNRQKALPQQLQHSVVAELLRVET